MGLKKIYAFSLKLELILSLKGLARLRSKRESSSVKNAPSHRREPKLCLGKELPVRI